LGIFFVLGRHSKELAAALEKSMGMESVLDILEHEHETPDNLYSDFCLNTVYCVRPGIKFVNENIFPRAVTYVLRCIAANMHDNEAQKPGRIMLRHLVGKEAAKEMIDYVELRHYQEACIEACYAGAV
jgi:hypothetical protein